MKRLLTEKQKSFYKLASELADDFATRADQHDRDGTFPLENYERMQKAGYLRLTVPEELGGLGASLVDLVIVQERLAMGCPSTALAVNMHVSPVGQLGSLWKSNRSPYLERWLRDVAAGRIIQASLLAEPGAPLLRHSTCKAERVVGGYVVSGRKIFGTGNEVMTHFSTMAQYEDPVRGPTVLFFRLPKSAQGIEFHDTWDVLGMRATRSNDYTMTNVFVPDDSVFHSFPAGHLDGVLLQSSFGWAMPTFGATYLGAAAGALELARKHAIDSGKRKSASVQHIFAEMEITLESARAVIYKIAEEVSSGAVLREMDIQEGMARVVLAKYVAGNSAVSIVNKCFDVVGGAAYYSKNHISRIYRDVRAATIQPYNNLDTLEIVGKTALRIEAAPANPIPHVTPTTEPAYVKSN